MTTYYPAPGTVARRIVDELLVRGVMSSAECAAAAHIDVRQVRAYFRRAINAGMVGIRRVSGNRSSYVALSRNASVWDYASKAGMQ
jgi:transcription initiation factor IIE alpha subunit